MPGFGEVAERLWRSTGLGCRTWVQAAVQLAPGNSGGPLGVNVRLAA